MKTVAVMQPYFMPYAGYFRLFAASDVVVMFDCVQFPRRGWVHRNRFTTANGELDWLTLPLKKADRAATITDLRFQDDASTSLNKAMERFPMLKRARDTGDALTQAVLRMDRGDVTSYLCDLVELVVGHLGISRPIIRSSSLEVPSDLKGQERVLAIVSAVGGDRYVNPPGGRELYDPSKFAERGVQLRFLQDYRGDSRSILELLLAHDRLSIADSITAQAELVA